MGEIIVTQNWVSLVSQTRVSEDQRISIIKIVGIMNRPEYIVLLGRKCIDAGSVLNIR